ncbi:hypothetical protein D3227_31085 [Mesorhizobium waimense]|uniref:Uncharacterized protein n=1 Tax=Mesorhizobium waimense TaxID=1300307 RepID=A0A3A5KBR7_9HYPH|nr:hypothetical protein D3227_31085 [Mesorhizobium waimense]
MELLASSTVGFEGTGSFAATSRALLQFSHFAATEKAIHFDNAERIAAPVILAYLWARKRLLCGLIPPRLDWVAGTKWRLFSWMRGWQCDYSAKLFRLSLYGRQSSW